MPRGVLCRPISDELLSAVAYVCPNESELQRLTGLPTHTDAQVVAAARALQVSVCVHVPKTSCFHAHVHAVTHKHTHTVSLSLTHSHTLTHSHIQTRRVLMLEFDACQTPSPQHVKLDEHVNMNNKAVRNPRSVLSNEARGGRP
jgi:hypothetical protein